VIKALRAEKHVFVEKPLCINEEELNEIADLLNSMTTEGPASNLQPTISSPLLMVGYNRRFSPLVKLIKKEFGNGPMALTYRINAGAIPKDSWIQDSKFGGGRIIGEVCHFVDTISFITGSLPVSVYANTMDDPNKLNDTLHVNLSFQNGSIGTISYLANGDKSLAKERIEVFAHGATAIVVDFKELTIYSRGKKKKKKLISQDKGQKEEIKQFIEAIITGKRYDGLIPFEEIYNTSLVTFKIIESLRTGECIRI
jgi:predicted dehydrogenase